MNWLYDLAQPFVWHPTRALIVALVWLSAAFIFRKTPRRPLFVGAGAWGIFALLEFEAWREHADIRVDLLFTWPVLCLITIGCLYVAIRNLTRHANILLAYLLLTGSLEAQNSWSWQNPLPQGNGLADICFVDSLRGWAVGSSGTTLRTTDGGQHWHHTQAPIHELLIRTSFVSPAHGWAMTYFTYKLLETTDGGISWDSISTIPTPSYHDLQFLNDSIGFVSGDNGKIMRTIDGGVNWTPTQTNYFGTLYALHFSSTLIGWAAGPGRWALKTTDGGLTWTQVATAGYLPSTRQVFSVDAQRAYLVGSHEFMGTITGCFYSTTNGGTTWQEKYFNQILSDVYFSSPNTGWVSDIDGVIFQTTDGGVTWTQLEGRSTRFTFAGAGKSWGVMGSGLILATDDGWHTYRLQTEAVTTWTLWALSAYDSNTVVACGSNSLVVGTTDGGRNWAQYYNPNRPSYLMDIIHKSVNEIWTVGEGGLVAHSTDGGASWSDSTFSTPWLSGIAFVTESIGYAVSSSGEVFRTSDGGRGWTLHTTLGNTPLERIVFANSLLGWIVADNGVHRSTDSGETWQHVYTQTGVPLDIAAIGNRVWFPRVNSVVYSTDAGSTWTTRTVFPVGNIISDIRSLAFSDESNGWAASNNGRIYRTTNGGDSWTMESDLNGNSLFGIRFVDSNRGWAVGGGGAILQFNNSATSVPELVTGDLPNRVALLQNYPNPFNPATTVRFALPYKSTVTLRVYNVLGKELEILFDGELEAGEFSIQWNAQHYPSGVYFYRLQSDPYMETKRMLLLK